MIFLNIFLGIMVGFIAAIPVGPLNLFAITQVLKRDFLHGFLVGITSAFLDVVYCFLALVGVSHAFKNLEHLVVYMKIIAVILLIGISIRLFRQSQHIGTELRKKPKAPHRPILTAFFLYITNPALYAFWLAVAGVMSSHHIVNNSLSNHIIFATSVGVGAASWYVILMKYVAKFHHQFTQTTFRNVFLFIAVVLLSFAIYTFYTIF